MAQPEHKHGPNCRCDPTINAASRAKPQCQHVPPSPGQSMCACEHRRIELELLVAALVEANQRLGQEVLTLQNRLDRRKPEVIDIGGRHSA